MTTVTLVESAGFCFGVNRSIEMVSALLEQNKKVCTLGPVIHNPQITRSLAERGARIIDNPEDAEQDEIIVIRSHGVGGDIYDRLESGGLQYADATCPFVSKIHKIVAEQSEAGRTILIAGDANHPEVTGIVGHCKSRAFVFDTPQDMLDIIKNTVETDKTEAILTAQTTFNTKIWGICTELIKNLYTNIKIFDTICNATVNCQKQSMELAERSDAFVVIGGRKSSNTQKLLQICSAYCPAVLVETKDELTYDFFLGKERIGVTAGASTPSYIIKEVINKMDEIIKDNINSEEESREFANLLSQTSGGKVYKGNRIKGIVTSVSRNEVKVDIGAKYAGIIPASELSDEPGVRPDDVVKKGDEITALVIKTNDLEGIATLSKKLYDAQANNEIFAIAYDTGATMEGTVVAVVKGGVSVLCNSSRVFIPASQVSLARMESFESLLKTTVRFRITDIRRSPVGSIRQVLIAERTEKESKFWNSVSVGDRYTGVVKSLTSYGAFVDLGGVDGMVHITELSWNRIKHPSEVVSEGDTLDVYVKDINADKRKISLGYRKAEDNPWNKFAEQYAVGDTVEAEVVSITAFGAFARIIPGVEGLIHISQISAERVAKVVDVLSVGQTVTAQITDINSDTKRISLSIRALIKEDQTPTDDEYKELKEAAESAGITFTTEEESEAEEVVEEEVVEEVVEEEVAEEIAEEITEEVAEIAETSEEVAENAEE
ncbi:MAG: bifunctional 4-hydroxy-3-methylbut-2-enyl diphosphate reductase/30S ribosomal protein S1 [Oscillospiraceae bacterium]|nr:bifunctional 4-hydroxy-3-methylbut-2-enyl diphosphate reductase/30S ribosomal protein S1 [Oscillospiraceae bacterium]